MTAKRLISGILSLVLVAAVMGPCLMAQSLASGDITGTVSDPSGAVVPGTVVSLENDATGETRKTTTGANGAYRFSLLPPGNYTLTVSAPNFSKAESKYEVNVGQATIADMKLAVGPASQTVEVTSAALVQPENADLSTNFSQSLIENQPNPGNDLTYIAQTAPGVSMNVAGGLGNFTAYGLPANSNLFTINGENDMDPFLNLNNSGATNLMLGRNEVQEATVITNAYSGQYGQQAGAQVNYVTKSGTNNYHGNLVYWWTGRAMDANDWFNNCGAACNTSLAPRPFANNNEWAASFGGPIKKNKLFFFLNTEGIRYIVPSTQPVFAPTPNFIAGSEAYLAANAPASLPLYTTYYKLFQHAPGYAGGATAFGSGDGGCGLPIVGNCIAQYQAAPALPGTEFVATLRLDYNLSDKDHLSWRGLVDQGTQDTYADPINPAFNAASYQPTYDGQGQWSHVFGANATNQLLYAGSYYRSIFTQDSCCAGFPIAVYGNGVNLTGVGGEVFEYPTGRNVTQYQLVDDFSWTTGPHALKFGANFRRYDITDYTFGTYQNARVLIDSSPDLFMGVAQQYRQDFPEKSTQPVALWGLGVYGQDEWRVNRSLKLTLALRLEHNSNPVCQTNCAAIGIAPFDQLIASGTLAADGSTPYNAFIANNQHQIFRATDAINLAPRFGFAWSPRGNDKTVVRGGFGLFYDALPAGVVNQYIKNLPQSIDERLANAMWADPATAAEAAACAAALQQGFANGVSWSGTNPINVVNGVPCRKPTWYNPGGTFHTARYQEWSFGIQQAVGERSSLGLNYVGNHGIHIPILNEGLNAWDPQYCGPQGVSACFGGALPLAPATNSFGVVEEYYTGAVSNYNGVTATFSQRVTYGFTVQASYTWSHTLDEVSNGGTEGYGGSSIEYQINPSCLRCNNYGNSDYDIRHSFNATYVWQTPWKFSNTFANGALGGWVVSQNFFARSGLPYTVLDGYDQVLNYGTVTPIASISTFTQNSCSNGLSHCVPMPNPNSPAGSPYFIPGFCNGPNGECLPLAYPFSNQHRNQYRGPGFFDSDLSVNKNFKLTERLAFGIGANFYNVFNHPNFTNPDPTLGDSTFGTITGTTAPPTGPYGSFATGLPSERIIQFQGKLVF